MGNKENNRLEIVRDERFGMADLVRVLRDRETGVCYLQTAWGAAGGLTVMLDAEGRPVVQR